MSDKISGLLSQKPDTPIPMVGQKKYFTWQPKRGKTGYPWIKINNANEDEGQLCEVLTVAKTNFVDAHGNLSFNLELQPLAEAAQPTRNGSLSKDDYWERKLEHEIAKTPQIMRMHSQAMALEILKLKVTLNELTVEDLTPNKLRSIADYFDNDCLEAASK
jgi:hypothetical protein